MISIVRQRVRVRRMALPAILTGAIVLAAACKGKSSGPTQVETATVTRRTIIVSTDATGTVEPVDTVAVKSQASGLIVKMPVEVGSAVKTGDIIAQIDTRNLQNDYQRAVAAEQAARSTLTVNTSARKRADILAQQGVITTAEHETAVVNEATARSSLVAAQTNLRVARQNLEFATVRAEVGGTIISKGASVGTVASSATSNVGGGSTIATIADLSRVRMRVLVNETDIANVHPGQSASVTVDALPNQTFNGVVEKVEPQATVQQSVTMFPVLVSLANPTRALLPGMNGEVTMITQRRDNVIAVPNDALRAASDVQLIAQALGINTDSLRTAMQRRGSAGGANANAAGGAPNGAPNGAPGGTTPNTGPNAGGRNTAQFAFVKQGSGWVPRRVRVGVSNYDYSEVLSGLNEGDVVALPAALLVQQQRNQQTERIRSMTGNGIPGSGSGGTRTGGAARSSGGGR